MESLLPEGDSKKGEIPFDLRYAVEKGALKLDLSIFSQALGGVVAAKLKTPEKKERTADFTELALGRYGATVENVMAGRHELEISVGKNALPAVAFYLSGELFGEKANRGFNIALLEEIARET